MLNYLTYNGKKSTDLGVYVTGSGSFDAAELDVDRYEVAGRNGDIIIPKNRYKNIPISYPAFIPKGFDGKVQSVRNWLRSAKTYARLDDTYDVNHFRLGLANGVQSFEPVNRNDASNFQLSFDCRPERFLKTGETPLTIEPEAHSYSGEIVSFETVAVDDMTKAEVTLAPIQSLNGYDHPWAAGAGKNLFRMDKNGGETLPLTTGSGVTFKVGSDKAIIEATGTASGAVECILSSYNLLQNYIIIPAGVYTISVEGLKAGMRFIFSGVGHNGVPYSVLTNTASQQTVTVTDGTDPFSSISLESDNGIATNTTIKIQIEAGSAKTSWAPYENLCPISGHAGATLYRTGKNLFDVESRVVGETNASGTATPNRYTLNDGVVSISASLGTYGRTMMSAQHLRAGTYTLSFEFSLSGTGNCAFSVRDMSANPKVDIVSDTRFYTSPASKTFTLTQDGEIAISILPHNSTAGTLTATNIQLELGSTATSYEPYVGTSYPVTFPQTVYGGTFDWVTGKLTVTMLGVDMGTLTWTKSGASSTDVGYYFRCESLTDRKSASTVLISSAFNHYDIVGLSNIVAAYGSAVNGIVFTSNSTAFGVIDGRYADAASFKTAMSGVQLVYELATPIEIDLTPTQVQTLLGLNNVWSDGTVEINYSDPFNVENPTQFDALPLFEITNPAANDVLSVNSINVTFTTGYTGTVVIDCETMNAYSGLANMNYLISATDFPVLTEGTNIVTWSGSGTCKMTPRWWEL